MTIELEENREPTIFNSLLACIFVGIFFFIALLYRQTDLALLAFLILLIRCARRQKPRQRSGLHSRHPGLPAFRTVAAHSLESERTSPQTPGKGL